MVVAERALPSSSPISGHDGARLPPLLPATETVAPPSTAEPNARWLPPSLLAVLVIGLALRVLVAAWLHGEPLYVWDERDYDMLAVNLVRHAEFAFESGQPVAIRPPLYPVLVAIVYHLTGEHNFTAVRLLNAALGAFTVYIVFLLGRRIYEEKTAIAAAAICALYPSLVATSGLVLTETTFTLLLCLSCLAMARYLATGSWRWVVACGGLFALGALTRSVLWLFPAPLFIFLMIASPEPSLRRRFFHAAIAIAAFAAVLAPWAIRNTRLQKTFTAVDVMGGRNFMMGNYEYTPSDRPWAAISIGGDRAWYKLVRERFPNDAKDLTQGQLDKLAMKYAIQYIAAHPLQTVHRDVAKFFHFWQLEREIVAGLHNGFWGGVSRPALLLIATVILASYVVVLVAGLFGAIVVPPGTWQIHWFLLLLIVFVCGIHTLAFGHSRYHLPLMPLVAIYAAAAIGQGRAIFFYGRRSALWLAGSLAAILALSWCYELALEAGKF